ncbi:hypothetical protein [Methylogaea oryzae]|uniref:Uncharacterized protein n=2 Tax=Methylogaea oryzae TaxID=1295382 RepID=A0A8D4VN88_9GAMM|nr:hypothetical protein [Methylogaea oryzae]BBL70998.1 hypothetical protein MoryE10_16040 [Methylogaea oryzae]
MVVRSELPRSKLGERLNFDFDHRPLETDATIFLRDGFEIDWRKTKQAFHDLMDNFDAHVDAEIERLASLQANALISNTGFVAIAAANALEIPSVVASSLNWADIFSYHADGSAYDAEHIGLARNAYKRASSYVAITPGILPEWHPRVQPIGPISAVGQNRRAQIAQVLGIDETAAWVVYAFGRDVPAAPASPPHNRNFVLFTPDAWDLPHGIKIGAVPFDFIDIVASSDIVISKPGYGIISEACCHDKKLVLLTREGWAETDALVDWTKNIGLLYGQYGCLDEIPLENVATWKPDSQKVTSLHLAGAHATQVIENAIYA